MHYSLMQDPTTEVDTTDATLELGPEGLFKNTYLEFLTSEIQTAIAQNLPECLIDTYQIMNALMNNFHFYEILNLEEIDKQIGRVCFEGSEPFLDLEKKTDLAIRLVWKWPAPSTASSS